MCQGSPQGYYSPPRPQQYQDEQEGGGGLLGKIKGFFGNDEQQQQQQVDCDINIDDVAVIPSSMYFECAWKLIFLNFLLLLYIYFLPADLG